MLIAARPACVRGYPDWKSPQSRLDEPRQRLEVVAALEHGADPRAELRRAAGELVEPALGELHVGERIVHVRVEARRDEDEVGLEPAHGRLDELARTRRGTRRRPSPAGSGTLSVVSSLVPGPPVPG